jgi:hypothetical protein
MNCVNLPTPSKEQNNIVTSLLSKSNVIVSAVAGSGKTTTIGFIGQAFVEANILLLTYNRKLKHETKARLKSYKIKNIQVHNYHSFCFNYWDVFGSTDQIIHDVLSSSSEPDNNPTFSYDLIIIDEAQDMTKLYYSLVAHIVKCSKFFPKFCILGDPNQTIYGFNGADSRYLTRASELFNWNRYPWITHTLSTSYRLTSKLTDFMNQVVLKQDTIKPGNTTNANTKPRYIFCDAFGSAPIKELTHHYLVKFNYTYNDIFILAPSVSSDLSPIKALANNLSANFNIPIFISGSDSDKLDSETIQGKLVFATFHQVKGLERKCVLLFGFDNSYFYYYKQDVSKQICPNEIYVGLTRCSERLTIFHHYKKSWLDFINPKLIDTYCYTERIRSTGLDPEEIMDPDTRISFNTANKLMTRYSSIQILNKKPKLSVTRLLSHLPSHIVNQALKHVEIIQLGNPVPKYNSKLLNLINPFDELDYQDTDPQDDYWINVKSKVASSIGINMIESVDDIIGTGIPIYYEYVKTGKISFLTWLDQLFWALTSGSRSNSSVYKPAFSRYKELKKIGSNNKYDPAHIFELVGIYLAISNNLIHKSAQISNYKLVTKDNLNLCVKRLDYNLNQSSELKLKFEEYIEADIQVDISGLETCLERTINGFVDCVTTDTIWEFKCLGGAIQQIHLLQLAVYGCVEWKKTRINRNLKILNILSGEKYEIKATPAQLFKVIETLIKYKFTPRPVLTDEEFVNLAIKI